MSKNDPRWDRIKDLFAAAQAVPEPEREAFLRERGAGHDTVHEVLELLGAHVSTEEQAGCAIGPYRLLENLGEGGFGTVWMAEQRAPVQRRVALKVLKAGMDSAQVLARFEQERQALALMQHPNIAQVYDAGTTKHGRPFFVMELVKGIPITDYASRERLTVQQRLELFVQVCRAVQHAHQKGVVHRDIKPRNVLVATVDGRPLAKVIDFGIAKAVTGRLTERTLFTEHRAMIGTLEYMSPEQAEGLLDVDTRADVYSLGALLYELLTGSTPFVAGKLMEAGFGEMLRTLREVEPERPSVRVSSKAGAGWAASGALGGREPKELFGALRGDLDWVVMKALEKDRGRRYGTADGLAADVERYLGGEAVEAVPPSLGYRVKKYCQRHRSSVIGASGVAIALSVGALATWTVHQANEHSADLRDYASAISRAAAFANSGSPQLADPVLSQCIPSMRGWEWDFLKSTATELPHPIPLIPGRQLRYVTFSPDGKLTHYLTGNTVVVANSSGNVILKHEIRHPGAGFLVATHSLSIIQGQGYTLEIIDIFNGTSRLIDNVAGLSGDGTCYAQWRISGSELWIMNSLDDSIRSKLYIPDMRTEPRHVALSHTGEWCQVYVGPNNSSPPHLLLCPSDSTFRRPMAGQIMFNPHGGMSLGSGQDLFDHSTGNVTLRSWPGSLEEYVDANHAIIRLSSARESLCVVELATGRMSRVGSRPIENHLTYEAFLERRHRHRFVLDSQRRVSMSLETGELLAPENAGTWPIAQLTPDSCWWLLSDYESTAIASARPPQVAIPTSPQPILSLSTDERMGMLAIRGCNRDTDTVFVPDTGVPHSVTLPSLIKHAARSGDGRFQARILEEGQLVVVPVDGRLPVWDADGCIGLAMNHSGTRIAVIARGSASIFCRGPSQRLIEPSILPMASSSAIQCVAICDALLATGGSNGDLRIYSYTPDTIETPWSTSGDPITHLSWSPDGNQLLVGSLTGRCRLLTVRSGVPSNAYQLEGHSDAIRGAAWTPLGDRVFTCSTDGTVHCWRTKAPSTNDHLAPLLTLSEPYFNARPTTLMMTSDGGRLVCGYDDGSMRVWDSVPWTERVQQVTPLFPQSPK